MTLWKRTTAMLLCLLLLCGCSPKTEPTTQPTVPGAPTEPKKDVVVLTEGMTDEQKAVVITAESFYLRGNRAQYDMGSVGSGVERRVVGKKAPEDYTAQNRGYTDCSGFTYDVYYTALGHKITGGTAYTGNYVKSAPNRILKEWPESKFQDFTAEQLKAKETEFRNALQPGDIVCYRYAGDDGGHAMLYVGNGMIIHSSGSSYNTDEKKERFEENGTYLYDSIDQYFDPTHRRYLFNKYCYVILRPLDAFESEIPEATRTRMESMRGIVAEKLSSLTYGQTVNPNDELTFTFNLENHANVAKTLIVTDTVPTGTAYLSGAQTVSGDTLSWSVTVPAGGTAQVSYKVKVTGAAGETVKGSGAVDGIVTECLPLTIGRTLTADEQAAIVTQATATSDKVGIDRVNEIYTNVLGIAPLDGYAVDSLTEALFDLWGGDYIMKRDGELYGAVAPYLYGGKMMAEEDKSSHNYVNRTRLLTKELMIVGDVIFADNEIFVFVSDGVYNTDTGEMFAPEVLESFICKDFFVVFRPSLMM